MTWPGAPALYILAVCIGAPLLGRLLRGRTLPSPGQDPRIEALADATAERAPLPVRLAAADLPPASSPGMFRSDELAALARLARDREYRTCEWTVSNGQRIADWLRNRFGDDLSDAQLGRIVLSMFWLCRHTLRAGSDDGPAWHLLSDSLAAAALDLTAVELRAEEAL